MYRAISSYVNFNLLVKDFSQYYESCAPKFIFFYIVCANELNECVV